MKKSLIAIVSLIALVTMSCKKSEDTASTSSKINYMNQDIQGKIGGKTWKYIQGEANTYLFGSADYSHFFNILDTADTDSCFSSSNQRSKIIFSYDDANEVMKPGSYKLKFDLSGTTDSKTVTFVVYENGSPMNYIASEGGYEIISVDTVKRLITGRMDARYDGKNYANGNFTLKYCSW